MNEEENWLHGEQIECPACQQQLYRVDHSPFYDEHFLYCDRCPIHVEVSYYDPVYERLYKQIYVPGNDQPQEDADTCLMHALEARLRPCTCGGAFRHDASRRCFSCHAPVIIENPLGIDLYRWCAALLSDGVDLTDDVLEEEARWMSQFVRAEDKWI